MLNLTAETTPKIFEQVVGPEMDKCVEHFKGELIKIRTGRAHTSMVEDLRVECYGSSMRLKEVAAISAPEASLITIQPWDKSVIKEIEKTILGSDLGVTPANDGNLIRVQLPQISQGRREELCKVMGKKLEECRTAIRNVRKDFQNLIKASEKDRDISEDIAKKLLDTLQACTDKFIANAEQLAQKKEAELKSF